LLLLRRIIVSYYHGGNEALKEKKNKFNLHFRNIIGNLLEIPEQKDTKMIKEKKEYLASTIESEDVQTVIRILIGWGRAVYVFKIKYLQYYYNL